MGQILFALLHIINIALNSLTGEIFNFNDKTTVDIIKEANYLAETHSVVTEDGYILTLHRIPSKSKESSKGPVLLVHGLLCSSADWVVLGSKSLAFALADTGYDVWLGNNRGNTYSRHHIQLDPDVNREEFFDFSYHEMGKYDLPAMIDYVLEETGYSHLPYVGFSEGTTQFWVMASEKPEYNKKVLQANFWAPVTDMYKIKCKPINLLANVPAIENVGIFGNLYELFPHATVGNHFRAFCAKFDSLSSKIFNLIGSSWERMPNEALKAQITQNFPAGMSLKQVYHYVQGARSGVFRPYNYGLQINQLIYGKSLPDPYNISALTAPVTLYYGEADIFVNNGVLLNKVVPQMKNATVLLVPYSDFNHLDFIYSTNNDWLVNATIHNINAAVDKPGSIETLFSL